MKHICFFMALLSLAGCGAQGFDTKRPNEAKKTPVQRAVTQEQLQSKLICEARGGYYSLELGCFE